LHIKTQLKGKHVDYTFKGIYYPFMSENEEQSGNKLLSVKEAASELGVNRQRVQALISSGRLPAQKVGSYYVIREADIELVRERKTGRPPKKPKG
jgi:excisionase family DNA binding protein